MTTLEMAGTDPFFNLAAEDYFFHHASDTVLDDGGLFWLWRNVPAVIVGRNQNANAEIDRTFVESRGIKVVRRLTGGGAVYHDLGNLNYSLLTRDFGGPIDFEPPSRPVLAAVRRLGGDAVLTGRNDLVVRVPNSDGFPRKFSGGAQTRSGGRLLHHGTLLFSTDLTAMASALTPDAEKFRSHAVASVRSRVVNLADVFPTGTTLGDFRAVLLDEVARTAGQTAATIRRRSLTAEETAGIERLREERYSRWDWNFGASPKSDFWGERRFSWGKLRIDLTIDRGMVGSVAFTGDFFAASDPDRLAERIRGLKFRREDWEASVTKEAISAVFPALDRESFFNLVFDSSTK